MAETRPDVELRIPADSAFLSVLRTATAGLAARLDFTLDDIEDLRIAVDEACAIVLPQARPESDLSCTFFLSPRRCAWRSPRTATSPGRRAATASRGPCSPRSPRPSMPDVDGEALTVTLSRTSGESG